MHDNSGQSHGLPPPSGVSAMLKTLWQRWMLIVLTTAVFVVLAGIYIAFTRPIYMANASILVDPGTPRETNPGGTPPDTGTAVASQVSVIESRDLLDRVFRDEHLVDDPEFSARGPLSGLMALIRTPKPLTEAEIFGNFRNNVSVEREGSTYVIAIAVTSHDPAKAARIANAITDSYTENLSDQKNAANQKAADFLDGKLADLQKHVADAERAVEGFKFDHDIDDADTGGSLRPQVDQLTAQLDSARDQAARAESRYRQAAEAGDTPKGMVKLSAIVNSATADKLRQQFDEQTAALSQAETVYGSRHPTIVNLKAELSRIKGLMVQEADRIMDQLKTERDLAASNVEKLEAKLAALRDRSRQADLDAITLRQLERQTDAARAALADFAGRSQEASYLTDMQFLQAHVISTAAAPITPVWPKPGLLALVSALLGLLAGCGLALSAGPRLPKGNRTAGRTRLPGTTDQPQQVAAIEPDEARPTAASPVALRPVKTLPTEHRPEAAGPAAPDPIRPKPSRPQLTLLPPVAPPPIEPQPAVSETVEQQPREPQPAISKAVEPQPMGSEAVETGSPGLPSLGVYDLPPAAAGTTRAQIKAIRESLKEPGESPLSLAVLRLIRQIIGRLDQHAEPFVLHVTSMEGSAERKLAAALIGIGLQQLEENVLIVEIADRPAGPSPLTSVSASRGTARFTDPASGLPTIVVGAEAAGDGVPSIETILAKAGSNVDFVVIAGRPLSDGAHDATLDAVSDLSIYAVGSTDGEAAVAARLGGRSTNGKATLVVRQSADRHAESGFHPRLAVPRTPPVAGQR